MNELGVVKYGDREIAYAVEFCRRKTLEISVMPDSAVQIRAPQGASLDAIAQKVQKKASWIIEKQDWFANFLRLCLQGNILVARRTCIWDDITD